MSTMQLKLLFLSLCIVNTFSNTLFPAQEVIDLTVKYSKSPYTLWEFTDWGDKNMECSYNTKEKEVACIDSQNKGMCLFYKTIVLTSDHPDFMLKVIRRNNKDYYLVGSYENDANTKVFVNADRKGAGADYTCLP